MQRHYLHGLTAAHGLMLTRTEQSGLCADRRQYEGNLAESFRFLGLCVLLVEPLVGVVAIEKLC